MLTDEIIHILLLDRTTNLSFNIDHSHILPRYKKLQSDQKSRTKDKAEVFTPYSIVKQMNDSFDSDFSGDYITRTVLEVTCGEAPFLTTRYDASTGISIPVKDRTGLLDRKLQHIPDTAPENWSNSASKALKSTYGYEWQEDSLFIARKNILLTVIEHYADKFYLSPSLNDIKTWATIISYNLFRMDGITMCIPETQTPAEIMNWEKNKMERFDGKPIELGLW